MNSIELSPPEQLMQMITGKWLSKPIYIAAELGIADLLQGGPKTVAALAEASGTHAPTLYRILRALASVGVFTETADGRFALTPMAEFLKTGAMRSIALMFNAEWNDRAWSRITDCVRTGETPFEKAHGEPITSWLEKHPEDAKILTTANAVKAAVSHRVIVDVYDFGGIHTLIDVGGGNGALLLAILAANPSMKGIVADLPSVVPEARRVIRSGNVEDRCQAVACDFFEKIPAGGDAYLLSHVLHDWPDEKCRCILENCRQAMPPASRLLIVEMIVPPGNEPSVAKLLDLEMLVVTGGRERTAAEFKSLLAASGFERLRIIPTPGNVFIIEGFRV